MTHARIASTWPDLEMSMRTRSFIAAIVAGGLSWGCAARVPEPANVVPGTPHVTWVLMYGDRDNADSEFSCQSGESTECVLPASRPSAQVFSDIHIYYHGAGAETRYQGTIDLGYLQGAGSHTSRANISVRKNESIANHSVTGIVTSTPGTYAVTWSLTATVVDSGQTLPITQTIQVTVK
jgi:hypothetical protein